MSSPVEPGAPGYTRPSRNIVAVSPLGQDQGPRGYLIDLVNDADFAAGRIHNLHAVTVPPDTIRGNHFHPGHSETVCVLRGEFHARFRHVITGETFDVAVPDVTPLRFIVPPDVAHAFLNTGQSDGVLVCYSDAPLAEGSVQRLQILP